MQTITTPLLCVNSVFLLSAINLLKLVHAHPQYFIFFVIVELSKLQIQTLSVTLKKKGAALECCSGKKRVCINVSVCAGKGVPLNVICHGEQHVVGRKLPSLGGKAVVISAKSFMTKSLLKKIAESELS